MIRLGGQRQVYLAAGATDMRKQIDGLAALVVDVLAADPFSSQVFVFCNRGRDKLKI
ncbi:IS66 Orf2 family protein, partial [Thiorhodococcus drewsii AZ1]